MWVVPAVVDIVLNFVIPIAFARLLIEAVNVPLVVIPGSYRVLMVFEMCVGSSQPHLAVAPRECARHLVRVRVALETALDTFAECVGAR